MAKAKSKSAPDKKPPTERKAKAPLTTRENLSALIGSARKILRKDKGLNGDVDRLPALTWVMFLKFLDDLEIVHEQEAELDGKKYQPIIEAPYRWRDWAAREDGITGDELLAFIGQEQAIRADGKKGRGLFAYLRGLAGEGAKGSQREVIANVFKGVQNRMVSGYLLRDILNKINGIHFSASEEIHTLSHLYESMLREMRDAAGDSGEFYTPRPVVRFMVQVTNPRLGDTILDPACGTGGFLVEAYDHLSAQVKTPAQRRQLQQETLFGQEAKPLPYMLVQMNLLLHGLEAPQIAYGNTLDRRIAEIGHAERVDVILTNPPFGGEEEAGIKNNFPPTMQTGETALLFLQYIMRKLRVAGASVRGGKAAERGGRAAVVVPNGTLFGDGVAAVIKEELLKEFNLHTIVRLPQGVFAPYTDIPANLLFFERGGPTETIWYYELPLPEGRKKYSKTAPLQFEEFASVLAWWNEREEGPQAWEVSANDVVVAGYNLDVKNPHSKKSLGNIDGSQLVGQICAREDDLEKVFRRIEIPSSPLPDGEALQRRLGALAEKVHIAESHFRAIASDAETLLAIRFRDAISNALLRRMAEVAPLVRRDVSIDPEQSYTELGVRSFYKGTFHRRTVPGAEFSWQDLYRVQVGDLIFSNIMAWEQAIAIARPEDDGCVGNHRMLTCEANPEHAIPGFLWYYFTTQEGFDKVYAASPGTAARNRTITAPALMAIEVPVPSLVVQQSFDRLQAEVTALKARYSATSEVKVEIFAENLGSVSPFGEASRA